MMHPRALRVMTVFGLAASWSAMLLVALSASPLRATPHAASHQPAPSLAPSPELAAIPDLASRLRSLSPERPAEYFILAEDIAGEATSEEARSLARHLFVLSYAVAPEADRPAVAPGVCLALASLAARPDEQQWLRAIAASLDPRLAFTRSAQQDGDAQETRYDLASALGHARAGEGRRAAKLLEKPEVRALLDRHERALGPANGTQALERIIRDWPDCPECHNERAVSRVRSAVPQYQLCPVCRGNPGPSLTSIELITHLRLESILLSGVQRSWSAQILVDEGTPLRDLDTDEIVAMYRVDPTRPYFRSGGWTDAP